MIEKSNRHLTKLTLFTWVNSLCMQIFTVMQSKGHGEALFGETRNTFCRTRSLSNATFSFWSRDVHPVQNLLLCTKFHENRFSKWRPLAILELFYHHTRPPTKSLLWSQLPVKCHVNLIQIWRYSYLNFSHIYLAWNAYSGPQNGGFGVTLDP